jgi:diketogulonate reductase-like aldo/keto reductase
MEELVALPGGNSVQTNQVLYNLAKRGIEWDLLPWCRERRIAIMAYSPFDQGPLLRKKALAEVARRHGRCGGDSSARLDHAAQGHDRDSESGEARPRSRELRGFESEIDR